MVKKTINFIIDIVLIAVVFAGTDLLMAKVFNSDNLFIEVLMYILFYAIAFGAKWLVCYLWRKSKAKVE